MESADSCKSHRPPCPGYCVSHMRGTKRFCREPQSFRGKTKYTQNQVTARFINILNNIRKSISDKLKVEYDNDYSKILINPKVVAYITLRNNLSNQEITILPKLIKIFLHDITNNSYSIEELQNLLNELNFKQYLRNSENKQLNDEDLTFLYDIFKLKSISDYNKAPEITYDFKALRLLQILLLKEQDFIEKFIESSQAYNAVPEVKKKSKKVIINTPQPEEQEEGLKQSNVNTFFTSKKINEPLEKKRGRKSKVIKQVHQSNINSMFSKTIE